MCESHFASLESGNRYYLHLKRNYLQGETSVLEAGMGGNLNFLHRPPQSMQRCTHPRLTPRDAYFLADTKSAEDSSVSERVTPKQQSRSSAAATMVALETLPRTRCLAHLLLMALFVPLSLLYILLASESRLLRPPPSRAAARKRRRPISQGWMDLAVALKNDINNVPLGFRLPL